MSEEEKPESPGKPICWLWGKAWQLKEELEAQARFLTRGDLEADDLVQELWVVAIEKLDTLRDQEKIGEWLRAILRNLAVSWHRKGSRSPVSLPEIDFVAPDTGPLEELLREESLKQEREYAWELIEMEFYWSPPLQSFLRAVLEIGWDESDALAQRLGITRAMVYRNRQRVLEHMMYRRRSGRPYAIGWYLIFATWKRHHAESTGKPLDEAGAGPA